MKSAVLDVNRMICDILQLIFTNYCVTINATKDATLIL